MKKLHKAAIFFIFFLNLVNYLQLLDCVELSVNHAEFSDHFCPKLKQVIRTERGENKNKGEKLPWNILYTYIYTQLKYFSLLEFEKKITMTT